MSRDGDGYGSHGMAEAPLFETAGVATASKSLRSDTRRGAQCPVPGTDRGVSEIKKCFSRGDPAVMTPTIAGGIEADG